MCFSSLKKGGDTFSNFFLSALRQRPKKGGWHATFPFTPLASLTE
jgi:hypothetical protein